MNSSMQAIQDKILAEAQHVYELQNSNFLYMNYFTLGIGLLVDILLVLRWWSTRDTFTLLLIIIVALAALVFALPRFSLFKQMRLAITDEGLYLFRPDYSIYTPWDNLLRHGNINMGRYLNTSVDAILLHQAAKDIPLQEGRESQTPAIEINSSGFWHLFSGQLLTDAIPIGYFMKSWQDSEVAAEILRHAPQVAEEA